MLYYSRQDLYFVRLTGDKSNYLCDKITSYNADISPDTPGNCMLSFIESLLKETDPF